MKEGIHPEYKEITVVMTDGAEFQTRTAANVPNGVIRLDVDPLNHPAWKGGSGMISSRKGQAAKFENKFGRFGFGGQKTKEGENQ